MTFENQFTPEENEVVQQLRNDPRPTLKPKFVEAIRQEMFAEMDKSFPPSAKRPQLRPQITPQIGILVVAAVIIVVVVIVAIIAAAQKQPIPQLTATIPPMSATPTLTLIQDANPTAATGEATVEASQTPNIVLSTVPVVTPSIALTGTGNPVITVEGPVQKIDLNMITIFNIYIQVDANDPILPQIHIGDNLRVEGYVVPQGDTIMIVAIHVTIVNTIIVKPPSGIPGLPPNCKISKNGHIKCSKQQRK